MKKNKYHPVSLKKISEHLMLAVYISHWIVEERSSSHSTGIRLHADICFSDKSAQLRDRRTSHLNFHLYCFRGKKPTVRRSRLHQNDLLDSSQAKSFANLNNRNISHCNSNAIIRTHPILLFIFEVSTVQK
jgi:hypothetical protein